MRHRRRNEQVIRYYRYVSFITLTLVFVQAVLAGRFLFVEGDALDVHEFVGNGITVVVIVQLMLSLAAGFAPALRLPLWTSILVILVVAQTGLGYVGRDNADAASIHVPTGVLLFGLAMLVAVLAFLDREEEEER
ncbi:MAG TPA: hypothetical protein VNL92_06810 [Dehalococcoidia bacterium]|nr:hypothetical protein [Dehalococcoidia bacterium]